MTMTDTEAKALALVNADYMMWTADNITTLVAGFKAMRAREAATEARHAAELRELKERFSEVAKEVQRILRANQLIQAQTQAILAPFILPAPDPLESWLHTSGYEGNSVVEQALADLTKSGGKIVWEAGE